MDFNKSSREVSVEDFVKEFFIVINWPIILIEDFIKAKVKAVITNLLYS